MADLIRTLYRHAAEFGIETAFTDDRNTVSWSGLAARVTAFAEDLRNAPNVLGLYGHNEIDWVVGLLGGWCAGKTVVPLPTHFSKEQLHHVLADAGISDIMSTLGACAFSASLGTRVRPVSGRSSNQSLAPADGGGIVIYTSGSTGTPKGVRLDFSQIAFQANILHDLIGANAQDVHLSLLPLSQLLEIICGICVPVLAGGRTHLATDKAQAVGEGRAQNFGELFKRRPATTTVLVPQLLSAWVAELEMSGQQAPAGLRFVAVGGAPLTGLLAERAWQLGIPAHEGYGLSECCSVVSVNTPNCRKPGTAGKPLPDLDVRIENDEIVVSGPTVMRGYLNGSNVDETWRTGDLGRMDADGFLTVVGRKDNLIVTAYGRNVSPEWIEAMLLADPRIQSCAVLGHGAPHLSVLLVPATFGEDWLDRTPRAQIHLWIECMCADAPSYAVPKDFAHCTVAEARQRGLLAANGEIDRRRVQLVFEDIRQMPEMIAV